MTVREIERVLQSYGVEDPKTESRIIVEWLFNVSYAEQMANMERSYRSAELENVLEKRKQRVPLQYIMGEWEFMGREFYVSPACLIPRADTEIIVEKAIEIAKKCQGVCDFAKNEGYEAADLCTGSGCIGLSLLMHGGIERVSLMDISLPALEMAKRNADRHGLSDRCEFILGDVCTDMPKKRFNLIVSNPPYIPTRDIEGLSEEVKKEPALALDGGADGLDIIRFLIGDGLGYLKESGAMVIEFGYDQGEAMDRLLRGKTDTGSIKSYELLYDYGGNVRGCVIFK